MKNQCVLCGKFKKYEDLTYQRTDDTEYSSEDEWFECVECTSKSNLEDHRKSLKDTL